MLTPNQKDVIESFDRPLFVAAGAGSGKTEVVMQRFVEALSCKFAEVDQILTITFTEKAAGEMVDRARGLLKKRNMIAERRLIEHARISTIHGFCSSLLRSHALALGLDPNFSVADESQSRLLKEESFKTCLERLIMDKGEPVVEIMFNCDPNRDGSLFKTIDSLFETLRCRGQSRPECLIPAIGFEGAKKNLKDSIADAYKALEQSGSNATKLLDKLEGLERAVEQTDRRQAIDLLLGNRPNTNCKARESLEIVVAARSAYLGSLHLYVVDLLHELLKSFGDEYQQNKQRAGVLDFEDLQLEAFRLLSDQEEIRKMVEESFKLIVVDEFQDTNQLQCEIIGKIARDNVCFVGDENQSIYRFRNADVDLFRKKRSEAAAAGIARTLPHNFRSQKEILNFVDKTFNRDGMLASDNYLKLEAAADPDENVEDLRVEVIVVDGDSREKEKARVPVTRPAEAELIARRLKELYESGTGHEPGKTAILLRKKADAEIYHDALERADIPNYLSIGRDFYQKLELGDAMSLLRMLVNPLDDVAFLGVLRSPMVNVSDDTLVMLREIAGRGTRQSSPPPLWPIVQSTRKLEKLPHDQFELIEQFSAEFIRLRRRSRRQSLEATIRFVIDFHDYAAIAAAGGSGKQAYANLMKLQDMAVDFEAVWGRDLAALVEFVENQRRTEAEEGDAPTEEEDGGAVRILTIHTAKGLEFPLVVWANMGAEFQHRAPSFICSEDGRIGLDYKILGDKDRHLYSYDELNDAEKVRGLEEEKRIGYVAMTRAKRHLILCGTTNIDKEAIGSSSRKPIEWVKELLDIQSGNSRLTSFIETAGRGASTEVDDLEGCAVSLTVCTDPEGLLEEINSEAAVFAGASVEKVNADINNKPPEASFVPSVASPSSLNTYRECKRRYFLDHVLYAQDLNTKPSRISTATENGMLSSTNMGTLVHKVLEKDLYEIESRPVTTEFIDRRVHEALGASIELNSFDFEYAVQLVENLKHIPVATELFRALTAGQLQRELSFSTLIGQTILQGQIDALCPITASGSSGATEMAGTLVVDYKTGQPGEGRTPEEAAQTYRLQMASYALAAGRLRPGPVRV
ncbi:MAG: UvrD-helicase domain-containing protein, partial [Thermoleophilia bacterium]|nr:UvrD-helicase domain-containing protein [Thermoleophilia bacterium]